MWVAKPFLPLQPHNFRSRRHSIQMESRDSNWMPHFWNFSSHFFRTLNHSSYFPHFHLHFSYAGDITSIACHQLWFHKPLSLSICSLSPPTRTYSDRKDRFKHITVRTLPSMPRQRPGQLPGVHLPLDFEPGISVRILSNAWDGALNDWPAGILCISRTDWVLGCIQHFWTFIISDMDIHGEYSR